MIIIGLDIGRLSVVGCKLKLRPKNPRDFYRTGDFFELKLSQSSIDFLIAQAPDIVVLEPTGTHYSRPWITPLIDAGIEVRLVGHDKLHSYRKFLDLPDKNDKADALALACYGFDYLGDRLRFIPIRSPDVRRMRDICLRLGFYAKVRTQFVNRLKQDLVGANPAKATYRTGKQPCGNPPPFWRWLAGENIGKKKATDYEIELSKSGGTGINLDIKADSEILLSIFRREQALEIELAELLANEIFSSYSLVFREFGFGLRISGIFLSQIYPFEKFMGPDGLPEVRREMGQTTKTNRYLSKRRFRSMMGLAPRELSSGAKIRKYKSGNRLCRKTWWQWCLSTVEPKKSRTTDLLKDMGEAIDLLKIQKVPSNKAKIKICAIACDKLFNELCKSVL